METSTYPLPWRSRFFSPHVVRQHSAMDCSAGCLATVARYFGKQISINRVRELIGVGQSGASLNQIEQAARALSFHTETRFSTPDDLRKQQLPAIINWKGYHWVVVFSISAKSATIGDPERGLRTVSLKTFAKEWTGYTLLLKPTEKFDQLENSPPPLRQLFPYFNRYRKTIFEILFASVMVQIMTLTIPLFSKFLLDEVILKEEQRWLASGLTAVFCLIFMNAIMTWLRQEMALQVGMRANLKIITQVYQRLLRLPLSFFESRKEGDIISRFEEHKKITQFITNSGLQMLVNLLTAFLYIAVMLYFHAELTAVACVFLLFHIVAMIYITPRIRQAFRETFVKGAQAESHVIESLQGVGTIKALGANHYSRWQFDNLYAGLVNTFFGGLRYTQASTLLAQLADHLSGIAVLFYGATLVPMGELSVGTLIALTLLTRALHQPATEILESWDALQEALNAVDRLNDILEKDPEYLPAQMDSNRIHIPRARGHIRFESVTFRHTSDNRHNIIQNINLNIQPGERVMLVGRSGSGKSTLLKLLYRFHEPTNGRILLDGFDIDDLWLPSLRESVGFAGQKPLIFQGSIRDNIAIVRPNASLKQIQQAAELAEAHRFISATPGGYDALLAERGSNLSGGQRQRLALARMFLLDPPILVLDEATSALDPITETRVLNNINSHFTGRTIIAIPHRPRFCESADQIVVLNKGIIVESGNYETLIKRRGLFHHLMRTYQDTPMV
ncbi:MAG: peptidase domain-containing ABC transporter [Magnetococcales bacterium]|nr:peptidase domain-containing ABC transporter [Magnetococcales bacterium]